ncbi:adhesion G protein-coupled receptor F5-like [Plectropomus leopardus]|uniref:adhesion G protein-coupled receptor F5-like n=1 Tax=Plectropomus leopardus TaxID=160734 RepID=UPI001C4C9CC9|nr:adhesion G protein-coupled receptor F5-like [Plectropomus leopardus]
MSARMFIFLFGAAYICYQVLATDYYLGEMMVESNVTLEAQTILSALNTAKLQVEIPIQSSHLVTVLHTELVAECVIVGDESSCSCSVGYIWSNEVCYTYNCCRETTCKQNVSHITPLCIAKVQVRITGSVTLNTGTWDGTQSSKLTDGFKLLNGFENLNVTGPRSDNKVADFEATVTVKMTTQKLLNIVTDLETNLKAVLQVNTEGMVTIESPNGTVCYESEPTLKCTYEEVTSSAAWYMSRGNSRFGLNNGSVVKLHHNCASAASCVAVTLKEVTGIWSGKYKAEIKIKLKL